MRMITLLAILITFMGCAKYQEDNSKKKEGKLTGFLNSVIGKGDTESNSTPTEVEKTSETELVNMSESSSAEKEDVSSIFSFPNFGFWVLLGVSIILVIIYAEIEDYGDNNQWKLGGNFIACIGVATLLWFNKEGIIELWNYWGYKGVLGILGIVTVTAVLNLWIKWQMKTAKALDEIKQREREFLERGKYADADGRIYSQVPNDKDIINERNKFFESQCWTLELPKRKDHKGLLTKWACLGTVSLPGTLLVNGAQMFGGEIQRRFGWLADFITNRHEKEILR